MAERPVGRAESHFLRSRKRRLGVSFGFHRQQRRRIETLDQIAPVIFTEITGFSAPRSQMATLTRIPASSEISSDTPGTVALLRADVSAEPAGTVLRLLECTWTQAVT